MANSRKQRRQTRRYRGGKARTQARAQQENQTLGVANNQTNTIVHTSNTVSNIPENVPTNNGIPEPNAVHRIANVVNVRSNNQTSLMRPNSPANIPANTPLAPASINTVNQREANLSPNIKTKMNRIKQKITNIHRSLRSFQAGGRRYGCATRKA
jgi:hypothetical protein